MKSRWILLMILLMVFGFAAAQTPAFERLSISQNSVTLRFRLPGFSWVPVFTEKGVWMRVVAKGAAPSMEKGAPELPHFSFSLLVPPDESPRLEIISAVHHDVHPVKIVPSKGKQYRNISRDSIPYLFGPSYQSGQFMPDRILWPGSKYQLRKQFGQVIQLTPFQYSGATQTLRIYDEVVIRISWRAGKKEPTKRPDAKVFENLYNTQFLNFRSGQFKNDGLSAAGRGTMLIISYGPFIPLLHDFVHWKKKTGFEVMVKDVAGLGDAAAIKAFIQQQFRQRDVTYVLLVGDAGLVPSSRLGGHDSDNDYAYVAGNDHYPDLFVGRFSAETSEQLKRMLNRSILYELYPVADSAWYHTAVGIASQQGPGYRGMFDYQHIRTIDSGLMDSLKYQPVFEYFDGSQGGRDAAGNPSAVQIVERLNDGVGLVNYCGHGNVGVWTTSGFNNEDVQQLTNRRKWPFIFSVSCATGNFVHHTCLAEALQRAGIFEIPTGAVASLMSTMDQSWEPPMYAQQQMNLLLQPKAINEHTFGAISMMACIQMNDQFGTDGFEITDTWTIFGDPSLEVRTRQPQRVILTAPDSLAVSRHNLTVHVTANQGRVTLLQNNLLVAGAPVDTGGNCILAWDSTLMSGEATLTYSGFNYRPVSKAIVFYSEDSLYSYVPDNKAGLVSLQVYPNPFRQQLKFYFETLDQVTLNVQLLNLNTKPVYQILNQKLNPGVHHLSWQLPDSKLTEGIYLLRFKTCEGVFFKKVIFRHP